MVIIKESTYFKIKNELSFNPKFECGGILGKKENCISVFEYDKIGSEKHCNMYFPDVNSLNKTLETWRDENVEFCGFVHSHPNGSSELSNGDINFVLKIIENFDNIDSLVMGIYVVLPELKSNYFVWYNVFKNGFCKIHPDVTK